ncbi:hypothetical protein AAMO2058_001681100 [Amorphochlora amoebiformis]
MGCASGRHPAPDDHDSVIYVVSNEYEDTQLDGICLDDIRVTQMGCIKVLGTSRDKTMFAVLQLIDVDGVRFALDLKVYNHASERRFAAILPKTYDQEGWKSSAQGFDFFDEKSEDLTHIPSPDGQTFLENNRRSNFKIQVLPYKEHKHSGNFQSGLCSARPTDETPELTRKLTTVEIPTTVEMEEYNGSFWRRQNGSIDVKVLTDTTVVLTGKVQKTVEYSSTDDLKIRRTNLKNE